MMGMLRIILILLVVVAGLNPTISQTNRQGKDFALFFAVENYSHWSALHNPIDDAEEIAKDLEELYGFETEVVKNPSRNQIYDKLDIYQRKAYAKDAQLLIFFSGHGDFIEGKGEGFFIPRDGKLQDRYQDTYLPHARLQRIIDNIPCPHVLLATDACYSGTFDEQVAARYKDKSGWSRPNDSEEAERQRFIENSLRYRSRLFMTSGGKERTPDPSAFAEAFKTALRAFGGQDRILEYAELYYQYLQKATPKPRFGEFGANQTGSNFLFVLKGDQKTSTTNREEPEVAVWHTAKEQHTIKAYRAYLQFYPNGKYRGEAEKHIRSLSPPDDMVFVKGGSFQMGSTEGDSDEKPVHTVTVSDFYIGRYEVTQAQWRSVMGSDPPELNNSGCDQCPVERVSWDDIQEFLQKLNAETGQNYRLPTEAEWEYAARGGNKSQGYVYSGSNDVAEVAWYSSNAREGNTDGSEKTTRPVGGKKPNELGLYDMSGNVWEWCSDWYGDYSSSAQQNPRGPGSGTYRVYRGGSWLSNPRNCRAANRLRFTPTIRSNYIGFRLARS
jgi:sulfatase modifying factor 1